MRRAVALATMVAALALSSPVATAQSAAVPSLAGLTLAEALERLRSSGLTIVYSSALVRPGMRVETEPGGRTVREIVERLLAPHGLTAIDGPGDSLLVVAGTVRAPRGEIRGIVRAHDTGEPLPDVLVRIPEADVAARSGRDGAFAFAGLPVGTYTVVATVPGYVESSVEGVAVAAGTETRLIVEPTPRPRFLQDVVVTPSRYGLLDAGPTSRRFLDREEVQRLPHLSDDVLRVVQRLPGTASGDVSAQFNVRGGAADEVAVVLDGLQIPDPFHLRGFYRLFSIIDSEMVEEVDVSMGGYPVEYGDRMSAVVDVASVVPRQSLRVVGLNGFNARAMVQNAEPDSGSSWLVSVRRGYLDWVNTWLGTIDESADVKAHPAYGDLFATVRQRVGEEGLLAAHLLVSLDDHDVLDTRDRKRSVGSTRSWFAWANLQQRLPGGLSALTTISASHASQRTVGSSEAGAAGSTELVDDRGFDILGLKQDWVLESWRSHLLKWGLEVRRAEASYDHDATFLVRDPLFTGLGPPTLVEHHSHLKPAGWQFGLYTAQRFRLTPGVIVEAGVRWDRQTWTPGSDQLSPRLSLVWETEKLGTFRAAWGRFAQSQAIYELQVADGVDTFYPAQLAEHRIVTWERVLPSAFVLRAEAYRKVMTHLQPRFENLVDQLDLFPEGQADRVRIAPARAEARGLELVVKSPAGHRWSWWAGLTFAAVEDRIDGEWIPRSWDQHTALNASLNWRPAQRWNLNLASSYHSGWPATPTSSSLVELPDGTIELVSEIGERNSGRLPAYWRTDLRVTRSVPLRRGMLRLFLEIMNLTNRTNQRVPERAAFQGDPGIYGVTWKDEDWLPILPTLGFTWEF